MLFDSHAHLNSHRFARDIDEVWSRARAAGVGAALVVGYDVESSKRAVEIANRLSGLRAAVGIHPHDSIETTLESIAELRELATDPMVAAIGETGLDLHRNLQSQAVQERSFRAHLELASECGLPVVVHIRNAFAEVQRIMRGYEGPGVIHCYTGGPSELAGFVEMGLHISFAGVLTYASGSGVREALRLVPAERLLIETDCPYLSPEPWRRGRNEPSYLVKTAEAAARTRGVTVAELAGTTFRNAAKLLKLELAS